MKFTISHKVVQLMLTFSLSFVLTGIVLSQEGIEGLQKQIETQKGANDKIGLAGSYNKLGYIYWQRNNFEEASKYYKLSLEINSSLSNSNAIRIVSGYLGLIYMEWEKYEESITHFKVSTKKNIAQKKWQEAISDYYNIASAYEMLGKYQSSNINAQKALDLSLEHNNMQSAKSCNLLLANNYEKLGNTKKAAEHFANFNTISKHLQQEELSKLQSEKTQIQTEKQKIQNEKQEILSENEKIISEKEKLLSEKEQVEEDLKSTEFKVKLRDLELEKKQREKQANLRFFALIIGFFILLMALFYMQSRHRKKVNQKLQDKNKEIEKQKVEIEKQRDYAAKQTKNLKSSIQYARRIQSAVIPKQEILFQHFNDSFVFYKPRDIVSGDFYWFVQKEDLIVLAAADCTGHGVPGAFMSMLGVAYLNEIVNKIAINVHINALTSDEVLNQLRERVISSLHQSDNKADPKDGMDIALCIINIENRTLQFSGAYNPLLIIREGEIIEFKGDKMPVSYHRRMNIPFTRHEIQLQDNDRLYIFSDGFIDQFGGKDATKYLMKRFKNKLLEIHEKSMHEQKAILEKEFDLWKGELDQIDDVLIIGIKYDGDQAYKKSDWSKKTILVAEDTDINYFLLSEVLKKTNAKLIRVKNGQEAVELINSQKIDLVLMDINMPIMDGYEATKIIKEYNSNIPIIIQTAIYENGKEQAIKAGADDFIAKPIDLKTFMAKISGFLN